MGIFVVIPDVRHCSKRAKRIRESKKRVTSLEKAVAHLQQEKNSAMEKCSLAKVEVLHVCVDVISKLYGKAWNIFSSFEK